MKTLEELKQDVINNKKSETAIIGSDQGYEIQTTFEYDDETEGAICHGIEAAEGSDKYLLLNSNEDVDIFEYSVLESAYELINLTNLELIINAATKGGYCAVAAEEYTLYFSKVPASDFIFNLSTNDGFIKEVDSLINIAEEMEISPNEFANSDKATYAERLTGAIQATLDNRGDIDDITELMRSSYESEVQEVYFLNPQNVEIEVARALEASGADSLADSVEVNLRAKSERLINYNNGLARHTYTEAFDTDLDNLIEYVCDFHGITSCNILVND